MSLRAAFKAGGAVSEAIRCVRLAAPVLEQVTSTYYNGRD